MTTEGREETEGIEDATLTLKAAALLMCRSIQEKMSRPSALSKDLSKRSKRKGSWRPSETESITRNLPKFVVKKRSKDRGN